jgi:Zinc-finger double-stranded RNA-binding
VDWATIESQTEEMFAAEWEQGSLFGWEETIQRMRSGGGSNDPLHCVACAKTYTNENVFMHHRKGRPHIKAVNEMSKRGTAIAEGA